MPQSTQNLADTMITSADTIGHKHTLTRIVKVANNTPKKDEHTDYLSIFNAISPVLLFFLGLQFTRIIEKDKEKKRLKKAEKYFYFSIPPLVHSIGLQLEEVKKSIKNLNEFNATELRIPLVPTFHTAKLKGISDTDMYTIFVSKKRGTNENIANYLNISQTADLIEITKTIIFQYNETIMIVAKDFFNQWAATHNELLDIHNELLSAREKGLLEADTLSIMTIIDAVIKNIKSNNLEFDTAKIDSYYRNFINPIYISYTDTKQIDANKDIYLLFRKMDKLYIDLGYFRTSQNQQLLSISTSLSNSIFYMNQAVIHYNERQKRKSENNI